jgi:hypothetical protein
VALLLRAVQLFDLSGNASHHANPFLFEDPLCVPQIVMRLLPATRAVSIAAGSC